MLVRVRTQDGRDLVVLIDEQKEVGFLKEQLHDLEGPPPPLQRLFYGSKVLISNQTLASYDITNGSLLHLIPSPTPACTKVDKKSF